jgi:hypothetical protein
MNKLAETGPRTAGALKRAELSINGVYLVSRVVIW